MLDPSGLGDPDQLGPAQPPVVPGPTGLLIPNTPAGSTGVGFHDRLVARGPTRTRLARQCQILPLVALGGEEGSEEELTLDQIYTALDTRTRVPLTKTEQTARKEDARFLLEGRADDRPLTALEAAGQAPRLALLGDPGAGKSTFVRMLLAWPGATNLGEAQTPPGCTAELLPDDRTAAQASNDRLVKALSDPGRSEERYLRLL